MGIINSEKTVYRRKVLLNSILMNELKYSKYIIHAHYEWKKPDHILSFYRSHDKTIDLGVILTITELPILRHNRKAFELSLIYRAYFISAYIHCLETSSDVNPQSYFSGLVLLCAINDLCNKKKAVICSPIERKKTIELSPISMFCAIRALTRISVEYSDLLTDSTKHKCEDTISDLLTYSSLPEIGYKKAAPVYSLLMEIKELYQSIMNQKCVLNEFSLFVDNGINSFTEINLKQLTIICEENPNPFWAGTLMRLYAHTHSKWYSQKDYNDYMVGFVQQFSKECVSYCIDTQNTNEIFLADNLIAIKRLSVKIDKAFPGVLSTDGKLHFYQ